MISIIHSRRERCCRCVDGEGMREVLVLSDVRCGGVGWEVGREVRGSEVTS